MVDLDFKSPAVAAIGSTSVVPAQVAKRGSVRTGRISPDLDLARVVTEEAPATDACRAILGGLLG